MLKITNLLRLCVMFCCFSMLSFAATAQDCDCEEDIANDGLGICISVILEGDTLEIWSPNACLATCIFGEDFTEVECDNTGGDWPGEGEYEDCDCEEEEGAEPICILTDVELGIVCPFPSLCVAECWGYSEDDVVDCEEYGFECIECLDEYDPVCVVDSTGAIYPFPSTCLAECLGLEITDEDCDDFIDIEDPFSDCECDEEEFDPVCVIDTLSGEVFPFPSACLAESLGLEITEDECDDFGGDWPGDGEIENCDCEEEEGAEPICVLTDAELGIVCPFPSLCVAECWGYSEDDVVDCEEYGFECLDCLDVYDPVCAVDSTGQVFPFPSACLAECLGLEISEEECDDFGGDWPGDDDEENSCECDDSDWESEGICIEVEYEGQTYIDWVPSECWADCLGYEEYTVVECADSGDPEVLDSCLIVILEEDITTLQNFLLSLAEACDLELPECILEAPIFDTDEEFLAYLEETCPDIFEGLMDTESENNLLNIYNDSKDDSEDIGFTDDQFFKAEPVKVDIFENPGVDYLKFNISAKAGETVQVSVTDMNGIEYIQQVQNVIKGNNNFAHDISTYPPNFYILTIQTKAGIVAKKFLKI